jgi:hypothetical protein
VGVGVHQAGYQAQASAVIVLVSFPGFKGGQYLVFLTDGRYQAIAGEEGAVGEST